MKDKAFLLFYHWTKSRKNTNLYQSITKSMKSMSLMMTNLAAIFHMKTILTIWSSVMKETMKLPNNQYPLR